MTQLRYSRSTACVLAFAVTSLLSACGLASDDRFGAYVDGAYYIVVSHEDKKIHFVEDAHPGPDSLLAEIKAGKGFGFKVWRDQSSCGLEDAKGNVFLIPTKGDAITYQGLRYEIATPSSEILKANGGREPSMQFVTVWDGERISIGYGYDKSMGIRLIDRYQNGSFDRRILLENGVGILAHCRGFALEDYIPRP